MQLGRLPWQQATLGLSRLAIHRPAAGQPAAASPAPPAACSHVLQCLQVAAPRPACCTARVLQPRAPRLPRAPGARAPAAARWGTPRPAAQAGRARTPAARLRGAARRGAAGQRALSRCKTGPRPRPAGPLGPAAGAGWRAGWATACRPHAGPGDWHSCSAAGGPASRRLPGDRAAHQTAPGSTPAPPWPPALRLRWASWPPAAPCTRPPGRGTWKGGWGRGGQGRWGERACKGACEGVVGEDGGRRRLV